MKNEKIESKTKMVSTIHLSMALEIKYSVLNEKSPSNL